MKIFLLLSLLKGSFQSLSDSQSYSRYLLRNLTPKVITQKAVKKTMTTIFEYLEFPTQFLNPHISAQLHLSDLSCLSSVYQLLLEDASLCFFIPAQL